MVGPSSSCAFVLRCLALLTRSHRTPSLLSSRPHRSQSLAEFSPPVVSQSFHNVLSLLSPCSRRVRTAIEPWPRNVRSVCSTSFTVFFTYWCRVLAAISVQSVTLSHITLIVLSLYSCCATCPMSCSGCMMRCTNGTAGTPIHSSV